ncbi:MAG: Rab family GTPase [Candidatus Heimdallarchaeota archaeon]
MGPIKDFIFKIILVGDMGVGRTSLMRKYMGGAYYLTYDLRTNIASPYSKELIVANQKVSLRFFDWEGPALPFWVRDSYFHNTDGAALVFDLTNLNSLHNLEKWFRRINKTCGQIPLVIIGNKIDLIDPCVIPSGKGEKYARKWGTKYFETSAKSGKNIEDAFMFLIKQIIEAKK